MSNITVNEARKIVYREAKKAWNDSDPIIFPNSAEKHGKADKYCTVSMKEVIPKRIALNVPDVKNSSHVEINIYTAEGKGEGLGDDIAQNFIRHFSGQCIDGIRFQDDIMPRQVGADNGFHRTLVMITFYWVSNPEL